MELHQLRYFTHVARHESISHAAQELHVSQPALSKSIAKLEGELGSQLFDRVGKRIRLNEKGRYFLARVQRALSDLDEGAVALKRLGGAEEGSLRIGVFGPQGDAIRCTNAFMQMNPGIHVVFDARQSSVEQNLMRAFDIVFYPAGAAFSGIRGVPYTRTAVRLAVCSDHPLANEHVVSLAQFKDDPFIFMNTTAGMYESSYQLCIESGFFPLVRAVTSSGAAQMMFVRSGLGVSLVDSLANAHAALGVKVLDLRVDLPDQMLCFACRPVDELVPAALRYLEFTFDFFGIPFDENARRQFSGNERSI